MSPHLHWGEISPVQLWHAIAQAPQPHGAGAEAYRRELVWREFAAHVLWHHPEIPDTPLRTEFTKLERRHDPGQLRAWQKGKTGVPIVDAGMRQLWSIGWMHNRVRMITASFLVKHLLLPWEDGEAWFWDTLVDADLANNAVNWQWVAGCGADAAPFFRIFNPVLQGRKFDPEGLYVRHWVPELAGLESRYITSPGRRRPRRWRPRGSNSASPTRIPRSIYPRDGRGRWRRCALPRERRPDSFTDAGRTVAKRELPPRCGAG